MKLLGFIFLCTVIAPSVAVDEPSVTPKQHYYQYNGAEFTKVTLPKNDSMSDSYEKVRKQNKYTGQSLQGDVCCTLSSDCCSIASFQLSVEKSMSVTMMTATARSFQFMSPSLSINLVF
mmetsp:Transcript_19461/g.32725  ORF Transcript_19461/g.32725 Transcript_19461/m.32725 type:complete len:119 (-) Transcript_19461:731-1087(-)